MNRDIGWWLEATFIVGGTLSALIAFLLLFVMFFYSIWRIEREMKRDGLPRPCPWDISAFRIIVYGGELVKSHAALVKAAERNIPDFYGLEPRHLVRYARPIDRFIARTFMVCTILTFVFVGILMLYQRFGQAA